MSGNLSVILSGGVVREANDAGVEGARGADSAMKRQGILTTWVFVGMPLYFIVMRSSGGSFDFADSPLSRRICSAQDDNILIR